MEYNGRVEYANQNKVVQNEGTSNGYHNNRTQNLQKYPDFDNLNNLIRTFKIRQENYIKLIQSFKRPKSTLKITSENEIKLLNSVLQQEKARSQEQNEILKSFSGFQLQDVVEKRFITRFCSRVCEIQVVANQRLKSMGLYDNIQDTLTTTFLDTLNQFLTKTPFEGDSTINFIILSSRKQLKDLMKYLVITSNQDEQDNSVKSRNPSKNSFYEAEDARNQKDQSEQPTNKTLDLSGLFESNNQNFLQHQQQQIILQQQQLKSLSSGKLTQTGVGSRQREQKDLQAQLLLGKRISAYFDEIYVRIYNVLDLDQQLMRTVMTFGRINDEDQDKSYLDLVSRNNYVKNGISNYCVKTNYQTQANPQQFQKLFYVQKEPPPGICDQPWRTTSACEQTRVLSTEHSPLKQFQREDNGFQLDPNISAVPSVSNIQYNNQIRPNENEPFNNQNISNNNIANSSNQNAESKNDHNFNNQNSMLHQLKPGYDNLQNCQLKVIATSGMNSNAQSQIEEQEQSIKSPKFKDIKQNSVSPEPIRQSKMRIYGFESKRSSLGHNQVAPQVNPQTVQQTIPSSNQANQNSQLKDSYLIQSMMNPDIEDLINIGSVGGNQNPVTIDQKDKESEKSLNNSIFNTINASATNSNNNHLLNYYPHQFNSQNTENQGANLLNKNQENLSHVKENQNGIKTGISENQITQSSCQNSNAVIKNKIQGDEVSTLANINLVNYNIKIANSQMETNLLGLNSGIRDIFNLNMNQMNRKQRETGGAIKTVIIRNNSKNQQALINAPQQIINNNNHTNNKLINSQNNQSVHKKDEGNSANNQINYGIKENGLISQAYMNSNQNSSQNIFSHEFQLKNNGSNLINGNTHINEPLTQKRGSPKNSYYTNNQNQNSADQIIYASSENQFTTISQRSTNPMKNTRMNTQNLSSEYQLTQNSEREIKNIPKSSNNVVTSVSSEYNSPTIFPRIQNNNIINNISLNNSTNNNLNNSMVHVGSSLNGNGHNAVGIPSVNQGSVYIGNKKKTSQSHHRKKEHISLPNRSSNASPGITQQVGMNVIIKRRDLSYEGNQLDQQLLQTKTNNIINMNNNPSSLRRSERLSSSNPYGPSSRGGVGASGVSESHPTEDSGFNENNVSSIQFNSFSQISIQNDMGQKPLSGNGQANHMPGLISTGIQETSNIVYSQLKNEFEGHFDKIEEIKTILRQTGNFNQNKDETSQFSVTASNNIFVNTAAQNNNSNGTNAVSSDQNFSSIGSNDQYLKTLKYFHAQSSSEAPGIAVAQNVLEFNKFIESSNNNDLSHSVPQTRNFESPTKNMQNQNLYYGSTPNIIEASNNNHPNINLTTANNLNTTNVVIINNTSFKAISQAPKPPMVGNPSNYKANNQFYNNSINTNSTGIHNLNSSSNAQPSSNATFGSKLENLNNQNNNFRDSKQISTHFNMIQFESSNVNEDNIIKEVEGIFNLGSFKPLQKSLAQKSPPNQFDDANMNLQPGQQNNINAISNLNHHQHNNPSLPPQHQNHNGNPSNNINIPYQSSQPINFDMHQNFNQTRYGNTLDEVQLKKLLYKFLEDEKIKQIK